MKNNQINNNRKNVSGIQIKIPCGAFCSNNCTDCLYADWYDRDKYNQILCRNSNIGRYVDPDDRYGCWHYEYENA